MLRDLTLVAEVISMVSFLSGEDWPPSLPWRFGLALHHMHPARFSLCLLFCFLGGRSEHHSVICCGSHRYVGCAQLWGTSPPHPISHFLYTDSNFKKWKEKTFPTSQISLLLQGAELLLVLFKPHHQAISFIHWLEKKSHLCCRKWPLLSE